MNENTTLEIKAYFEAARPAKARVMGSVAIPAGWALSWAETGKLAETHTVRYATQAEAEARIPAVIAARDAQRARYAAEATQVEEAKAAEAAAVAAQPRFTKVAGVWCIKGAGLTVGATVTVVRQNGSTSQVIVGEIVSRDGETVVATIGGQVSATGARTGWSNERRRREGRPSASVERDMILGSRYEDDVLTYDYS